MKTRSVYIRKKKKQAEITQLRFYHLPLGTYLRHTMLTRRQDTLNTLSKHNMATRQLLLIWKETQKSFFALKGEGKIGDKLGGASNYYSYYS